MPEPAQRLDVAALRPALAQALGEDVGTGDITTDSLVPREKAAAAELVARAGGVLAGLPLALEVFRILDERVEASVLVRDGAAVEAGMPLALIEGPARALLTAERTALNVLQRLSGVATLTRTYVDAVTGTGAKVYDTRKTTAGWRVAEKYAVRMGGGANHRMGLYDQVLIKDNHIAFRRELSLPGIIDLTRQAAPPGTQVEVEVDSLEQLLAVLPARPDIVLLDNMTPETVAEAVRVTAQTCGETRPQLEASGGIGLENVRAYAESGVDRIAIGALTHSAPALDIALDLREA